MAEPEHQMRRIDPRREIGSLTTDVEWFEAAKVLQVLRPSLNANQFVSSREQLTSEGYHLVGLRVGGQIVSIASYTISPHATLGRELLIHDMATLPAAQGCGYASAVLEKLSELAKAAKCGRLFVHTRSAQFLYSKGGFESYSIGMIKKLDG